MSFLQGVTPVILTFNEAPNIGRCLERLSWAREIVVVDSQSTDDTQAICATFPQVRFFTRPFDHHAAQWNYAVQETGVESAWILALDADYMLTDEAAREIDALRPGASVAGYWLRFRYAVLGKPLRSGIYPPVLALFRRGAGRHVQDGHTQRAVVDGQTGQVSAHLIHDDRKSFDRWVRSQLAYARLEADKLATPAPGLRGWLRTRTPLSMFAVGAYCLVVRGGFFEGPAGWFYALQRMIAEGLICAAYLDSALSRSSPPADR